MVDFVFLANIINALLVVFAVIASITSETQFSNIRNPNLLFESFCHIASLYLSNGPLGLNFSLKPNWTKWRRYLLVVSQSLKSTCLGVPWSPPSLTVITGPSHFLAKLLRLFWFHVVPSVTVRQVLNSPRKLLNTHCSCPTFGLYFFRLLYFIFTETNYFWLWELFFVTMSLRESLLAQKIFHLVLPKHHQSNLLSLSNLGFSRSVRHALPPSLNYMCLVSFSIIILMIKIWLPDLKSILSRHARSCHGLIPLFWTPSCLHLNLAQLCVSGL